MPRGSKPGERRGGREAGTPNRITLTIAEKLQELGCDPIEFQAIVVSNKLPCGVCRGTGKTKYALPAETPAEIDNPRLSERTCQSCYGSLFEACNPELRNKAAAELSQYIYPKRKAVELTGGDGVSLPVWQVVLPDVKGKK